MPRVLRVLQPFTVAARCNACGEAVNFAFPPVKSRASAIGVGDEREVPELAAPWRLFDALVPAICPRVECRALSVLRLVFESSRSDPREPFLDVGDVRTQRSAEVIWPPCVRPIPGDGLPAGIHGDMREGVSCMAYGLNNAACVMFRKAMEKACVLRGVDRSVRGLKAKLAEALKKGLLSQQVYDLASAVKGVGDTGAHGDYDPVTGVDREPILPTDAEATCTAAIHVLNHLFLTPALTSEITRKFPAR
jgi:hypothetical protein